MRSLLSILLLDNLLHHRKPGLFGLFKHLEVFVWELEDDTFVAVTFEGAGKFLAREYVLLTHERATSKN